MEHLLIWIMENGKNQIACFLEILMILTCIHGIFAEKFRFAIGNVTIILLNLVIMALIYAGAIRQFMAFGIYVLLFIYCWKRFTRRFWETLIRFVLAFLLAGLLEVVASIIMIPIVRVWNVGDWHMLLINLISFIIAITIFMITDIRKGKLHINFNKEKWGFMILICGVGMLIIVIDYKLRGKVDQVYYFFFLIACVIVCFESISTQSAKHEFEKKLLEMDMKRVYSDTYAELLDGVRHRQHDYMNQLSAIYSMHLTSTTLDELVEKQKAYADVLMKESRYDKILTGCNNSILAGYLYNKFVKFEIEGVRVDYHICVDTAYCNMHLHEIIELLGIFLTNAFEKCIDEDEKRICFVMEENEGNLAFEVCNVSRELMSKEIEQMFTSGYSTKGENRGTGLARAKQLTLQYGVDLVVKNRKVQDKNWICFQIVIPKKKG